MVSKHLEKIKKRYNQLVEQGAFTPQSIGFYLIALLSVSVMYSGSKVIQQNYELTQQVRRIEQENQVIELENTNKELKNQYYATEEYADITARSSFGKALPGERVYIVPNGVALEALTTPPESLKEIENDDNIPQYRKNIEAWMNIYFGQR